MRQKLGQHFLASQTWRERIARIVFGAAPRGPGGLWIEIGAGHGEMTSLLAKHAGRVLAIELDQSLLGGLRDLAKRLGNVSVVAGDVLSLDLAKLAANGPFCVYGNIPYYISSPIVHHLLAGPGKLQAAFLVVQFELAARLAAAPGKRDYGYLSAFTQLYARSEILLRIPPAAFRPPPRVDSALVALRPPGRRDELGLPDEKGFAEFLKTCFAQKRKTLRNNLRPLLAGENGERLLNECGISAGARAEQLSLEQMACLYRRVRPDAR